MKFTFDLVYLVAAVGVDLSIYDLSGRRVRRLVASTRAAGRFTEAWDGMNDDGGLVPPGNYLCRIDVLTQEESFTRSLVVAVAY